MSQNARTVQGPANPSVGSSTGPLGGRNDGFLVGRATNHGVCPEFAEWDGVVYATERSARLALDQANHWRPGWRVYALTDITERPTE
ncbi:MULTISPECIES: hypothetical protein [Nocardia]|uniref:hypothetical protein n=1 Tax=Nocardia TaxID=1817 RepID=UPI0024548076|nr:MULTISPECIES: hypothetical protein [Nocardia]